MMSFLRILLLLIATISTTKAQTAVLFGASGAVGSEILHSLLNHNSSTYFKELFIVGRKSSSSRKKVDDVLATSGGVSPAIQRVELDDLASINNADAHNSNHNLPEKADACFVAIGVGKINECSLSYWHSVEVDMIGSIAQFCDKIQVKSLTLLSAIDVEYEYVEPYTTEELSDDKEEKQLGWLTAIYHYDRIKALEEKAVIDAAKHIDYIRLFQPSTIVTHGESRYGWVERFFFWFAYMFDDIIPEEYHSIDVRVLGLAMVKDAEEVLQSTDETELTKIAKLTYEDFIRLTGDEFAKKSQQPSDEL